MVFCFNSKSNVSTNYLFWCENVTFQVKLLVRKRYDFFGAKTLLILYILSSIIRFSPIGLLWEFYVNGQPERAGIGIGC